MKVNQVPYSIEIEEAVLGAMIYNNEIIPEVLDLLSPECFFIPDNRIIFEVIKYLFSGKIFVEEVIIHEEIIKRGGDTSLTYILELQESFPAISGVPKYCNELISKYKLRYLIRLTDEISKECSQLSADPDDILLKLNDGLKNYNIKGIKYSKIKDAIAEYVLDIEERAKNPNTNTGLKTGIAKFDNLTGGLQDDDFIIIGARPSMGKTAFLLNIINGCSLHSNKPNILVNSLESSKEKLINRMVAQKSRINTRDLLSGKELQRYELDKFYGSAAELSDYNITFIDEPNMKFDKLISSAIYLNSQNKLDLVCIDYAQLIGLDPKKNKLEALEDVSRGLKGLARTINCPVIALAQLNRDLEKRPNKRPIMSDLKGTGSFEQDADIIMFIYRDIVYNPKTETPDLAEIIIGKSRESGTGMFKQKFIPEYTLFEPYGDY